MGGAGDTELLRRKGDPWAVGGGSGPGSEGQLSGSARPPPPLGAVEGPGVHRETRVSPAADRCPVCTEGDTGGWLSQHPAQTWWDTSPPEVTGRTRMGLPEPGASGWLPPTAPRLREGSPAPGPEWWCPLRAGLASGRVPFLPREPCFVAASPVPWDSGCCPFPLILFVLYSVTMLYLYISIFYNTRR